MKGVSLQNYKNCFSTFLVDGEVWQVAAFGKCFQEVDKCLVGKGHLLVDGIVHNDKLVFFASYHELSVKGDIQF